MTNRKDLIILVLSTFCVAATLFMVIPTRSQRSQAPPEYDPWCDINDDGVIDVHDITKLILMFQARGTPINKTALLLELQSRIDALEARIPKKGYLSISTSDFMPMDCYWTYLINDGSKLEGTYSYFAPVQLPDKVIVKNITFNAYDALNTAEVHMALHKVTRTGGHERMAVMSTPYEGDAGNYTIYPFAIIDPQIDNQNGAYYLEVYFTTTATSNLRLYSTWIEYEYPQ